MRKCLFYFLLGIVNFLSCLCAQGVPSAMEDTTSIENLFLRQSALFPQEKIYIQTDKSTYVTGETMWMKIYLVDATFMQQANASRYVYVELLNPLNKIAQRVMIRPDSLGHFFGQIPIDETLPEGDYCLRAYTQYMRNLGEDYFFRRPIRIIDPLSAEFTSEVAFTFDDKTVNAHIIFYSFSDKRKVKPEICSVLLHEDDISIEGEPLEFDKDTVADLKCKAKELADGSVLLLKTVYEGKKYHRFVPVPKPDGAFNVTFFPEGGQALCSTDIQIAFKAMNANGHSEHVTGVVYDDTGTACATFESEHLGMGSFRMYYHPERTYYAVCTNRNNISHRFEVPQAQSAGCALKVIKGRNDIRVAVSRTAGFMLPENIQLVAHVRGIVLYSEPWNDQRGYVVFDPDFFPAGVVHLLLIDGERNILSERLVFSSQRSTWAKVEVTSDKTNYNAREKVMLDIAVEDDHQQPLSGHISLSVVDRQDVAIDSMVSILSTFLLTSELKGYIESPMSYMEMDNKKSARALDVLMMTQGWRRYSIPTLLKGELTCAADYPVETSQHISGKATGFFSSTNGGEVSLIAIRDSVVGTLVSQTDKDGRFQFRDFEFPDSTWYIVQALTKKGSQRTFIALDPEYSSHRVELPLIRLAGTDAPYTMKEYVKKSNDKYAIEHGMRVINLAEVEIVASAVQKKRVGTSSPYYSVSTSKVITEEEINRNKTMQSVFDLLRHLPGVTVNGSEVLYRQKAPLLILDNIPMEQYDYDNIQVGDVTDAFVARAESVMPVFGTRAANGAIIINTKKGVVESHSMNKNMQTLQPIGYQQTVEFYSPTYETEKDRQRTAPDFRTTIYWNPNILLDETGKANVSFYTADPSTTYGIVIEGISKAGHLIFSNHKYINRNKGSE